LRQIAAQLEKLGHLDERDQPFNAKSIKSMLEQQAICRLPNTALPLNASD
jgi:hypothetical protein